jgi:hypothetical protein
MIPINNLLAELAKHDKRIARYYTISVVLSVLLGVLIGYLLAIH